ncbi:hypothetical protein PHLGIDRAFT_33126 [Phlebiopsis gigantea 11061_1 CR5-6]|uniref:Uncharacterized protein n=1 Tax=Phlebiopsis gigantea (strain 11061_1 CR5-6) TaxID=745531 RepID=A0A0C3SDH0_PHLG1|nr:hypothetical protein PHLGIDRAFT_33126 [Phlebiopsis gigantea 11061_1 CR5-6]
MRIARRPLRVDSRPLASHLMSAELEAGRMPPFDIPAPSKGAQLPVPGPLRLVVRDINLVMAKSSRPWMYHIWALLRDVALPNLRAIDLQVAGVNQGDQSEVKWSEGGTVPEPAGRLLSRLSSHPPSEVSVHYCTAISPFIWRFVTTHLPAPGAAKRLLYVSAAQIDPVMGILRLFNDECECRRCNGKAEEVDYELQVYTDPTDGSLRCLSVGPEFSHMLTMQIEPSGTVSRVCLMMDDPSYFLPPSENPPSYPPAALDSTLTRLDQLCESLGATLRDVVIAYFPFHAQDPIPPAELASTMRGLRAQMPGTSGRRRLVFRTSRKAWEDFRDEHVEYDTVSERVFERGGSYWADVVLDGQQAAPLERQVDLSVRV